jgi:hypothetical protein
MDLSFMNMMCLSLALVVLDCAPPLKPLARV